MRRRNRSFDWRRLKSKVSKLSRRTLRSLVRARTRALAEATSQYLVEHAPQLRHKR